MLRKVGITSISVLAIAAMWRLFPLVGFAQGVINITDCRPITAPGSYRVANNLSGTTGQSCLNIQSSNVTIDGNGKTITDTSGNYAVLILSDGTPWSNITVSNFTSNEGFWVYHSASNVSVTNVTLGGFTVSGADHVSLTNSTVNGGVSLVNLGTENANYITFTGNTVTGSSDRLAYFSGDGHTTGNCDTTGYTIENNTFTDTITNTNNNPLAVFLSCTENGTFKNNTVITTGQATGLLIRDGYSHNIISGNTVHVNQAVNDSRGAIAFVSGSSGGPANFNTISNNIVIGDNAKALFMYDATGTGNTGNVFQNNLFISNSGSGSQEFYTTKDASNPNIFSHNTFIERGTGPAFSFPDDGVADGMRYTTLHDNIFVSASGSVIGGNTSIRTGFVANHNLYRNRSGSANFNGIGGFSTWASNVGDTNSIEADPLFVDYANGNYHLQASSPAVGAGTGGTDIGAYPLSGGSCTESWTCGNWSACTNNSQTRTCTDAFSCGTIVNRPALTQSCDSTAPTVSVTAPSNSATVSGTISVTASASDNTGVAGVQFKLDGANIGSEDTTAPYSVSWNTTTATNASHAITAVARDAAGNTTTSSTVTVTVNNAVGCTEDWATIPCSAWSACTNGTQTRTCSDAHNCGTTVNRPPLSQSCSSPDTTAPSSVQDLRPS